MRHTRRSLSSPAEPLISHRRACAGGEVNPPRSLRIAKTPNQQTNDGQRRKREVSPPDTYSENLARFDPGGPHVAVHLIGPNESIPTMGAPRHHTQDVLGHEHQANAIDDGPVRAREDEHTAGSQHPGSLGHHRGGVANVLENLHAYHGVEGAVGKGEALTHATDEPDPAARRATVGLPSLQRRQRRIKRHHGELVVTEGCTEEASSRSEIENTMRTCSELGPEDSGNEGDPNRGQQHAETV